MYRFGIKILKTALPTALAFYTIRPIFSNQQSKTTNNQLPIFPKIQINLQSPSQQQKTQAQQQQKQQTPKISNKQSQQIKNQQDQNSKRVNQKKEQIKQSEQSNKQQQQHVFQQVQQKNKQILDNEAEVSENTPNFIIKYLQLRQVKIKVNKNLSQKQIKLKNKQGNSITLKIQQNNMGNNHTIFNISNFIQPVNVINSNTQISNILKMLNNDQYLIVTYIPQQSEYKNSKKPKSEFDTFTAAQNIDIKQLQKQFRNKKYTSGSNKNIFVIIRDPQIAKSIKINPNKIGNKYIYYKSTPNQGMEVSSLLQGQKFTIKTIPAQVPINKDIIQTGIYSYINQIDFDEDMFNFLRSVELKKDERKILVIYSKQKRPQFIKQVKSITIKTAKMMKQDVLVVMTNNQRILRKYFQIIPDDFVTVRLIDTNKFQLPILSLLGFNHSLNKFYSRKILSGPFNVQNLCRFVKRNGEWKQYYENKQKLPIFQSLISQNQVIPNNSVVLHWKHGCKGCQLTLKFLQQIKKVIDNLDENKRYSYQIQNPQILKSIKFFRFNILNQQTHNNEKQHDLTPKLILHKNGKQKNLQVGEIIGKINAITVNNYDKIHQLIMKEIIQVICKNVQNLNNSIV